jgi:hypothetical protein
MLLWYISIYFHHLRPNIEMNLGLNRIQAILLQVLVIIDFSTRKYEF